MPTSKFVIKSWNIKNPDDVKEDVFYDLGKARSAYNFESARPGRKATFLHLDLATEEKIDGGF